MKPENRTHLLNEEFEQRGHSHCDLILPEKQPPVEKESENSNKLSMGLIQGRIT